MRPGYFRNDFFPSVPNSPRKNYRRNINISGGNKEVDLATKNIIFI